MKISIDKLYDITRDPQFIETNIELPELISTNSIKNIEPVNIKIKVTKQSIKDYRVSGDIVTKIEMDCSNCLHNLWVEIHVELNELFTQDDNTSYIRDCLHEMDLDEDVDYEDHNQIIGQEIDLKPFIIQEILLNIPMKPLCTSDCIGLCPKCGINKNISNCSCNTERIDPRLADLADFFNK